MRQDPRKLALAQQVSHRMAVLHESDAEICAALGISPEVLLSVARTKLFKQTYQRTLDKLDDKVAEKSLAVSYGSLEEMVKIRRTNAWDAYLRIVDIAKTAESEKLRFDANKWLASAGGISEIQESLPAARTDRLSMDDQTREFVVATIRETERVKKLSVQRELPEGEGADVIDIAT